MEPDILFKRKIYSQLLKWKQESRGKSALLIEGARRIGKSTIVKSFGNIIMRWIFFSHVELKFYLLR